MNAKLQLLLKNKKVWLALGAVVFYGLGAALGIYPPEAALKELWGFLQVLGVLGG